MRNDLSKVVQLVYQKKNHPVKDRVEIASERYVRRSTPDLDIRFMKHHMAHEDGFTVLYEHQVETVARRVDIACASVARFVVGAWLRHHQRILICHFSRSRALCRSSRHQHEMARQCEENGRYFHRLSFLVWVCRGENSSVGHCIPTSDTRNRICHRCDSGGCRFSPCSSPQSVKVKLVGASRRAERPRDVGLAAPHWLFYPCFGDEHLSTVGADGGGRFWFEIPLPFLNLVSCKHGSSSDIVSDTFAMHGGQVCCEDAFFCAVRAGLSWASWNTSFQRTLYIQYQAGGGKWLRFYVLFSAIARQ